MAEDTEARFVAFADAERIAMGTLAEAAVAAKRRIDRGGASVLVFNAETGDVRDLDLRGTDAEVRGRYASPPPGGAKRGRPRLGVVAREVTLLPRHWDWLAAQSGGASVALRALVEAARKQDDPAGDTRRRREAAYRFMSAMAGDRPGFEDASRALFAGDHERLRRCTGAWPSDVRNQVFGFLETVGED